jgi:hypothetical protein
MTLKRYIENEARHILNPFMGKRGTSSDPDNNNAGAILGISAVAWFVCFVTVGTLAEDGMAVADFFSFAPYMLIPGISMFLLYAYVGIKYKELSGWEVGNVENVIKNFLMLPIVAPFFAGLALNAIWRGGRVFITVGVSEIAHKLIEK